MKHSSLIFLLCVLLLITSCIATGNNEEMFTDEPNSDDTSDEKSYEDYKYVRDGIQFCSVHHIQLQKDTVPAIYGTVGFSDEYLKAYKEFPNSNNEAFMGMGNIYSPSTEEVLYCPNCREAKSKWSEQLSAIDKAKLLREIKESTNINQADANGLTLLRTAVFCGFADIVKMLIDKGANVNTESGAEHTDLHSAVFHNHIDIVKILIEAGAKIDARDEAGRTPLHEGAWFASKEVVKLLVENGADINAEDNNGSTPLHYASYIEVATYLEELGAILDPAFIHRIEKASDINAKVNDNGDTLLHEAVDKGDYNAVKKLIDKGADVNVRNESGEIPLHFCYLEPHPGVLKLLIDSGANVNAKDDYGDTPLNNLLITNYGTASAMKILIDAGANVNTPDDLGNTPLHGAVVYADYADTESIKVLLNAGADVNIKNEFGETPLDTALSLGTEEDEVVKLLRQSDTKSSPNVPKSDDTPDEKSYEDYIYIRDGNWFCSVHHIQFQKDTSPPIMSGLAGFPDEYLKADREFPNSNTEFLREFLVDRLAGRYFYSPEEAKYCPSCREAELKRSEEVRVIHKAELLREIEESTNINQADANGFTLLGTAVDYGYEDIVKILIDKGCNVNTESSTDYMEIGAVYKYTPLHSAASGNYVDVAKILIEAGAKIDARDTYGGTPLHDAARFVSKDVVKLLVENGADINAEDNDGDTPLHEAVFYTDTETIRVLLNAGADVNIKNESGETPLDEALYTGAEEDEVVKLLRQYSR
ncbi:ankyrin repeat domain-containing protein [Planctomycetota bacterium]